MALSKHKLANQEYVMAKLEEIHEDVGQLKQHVDELRQEAAERRVMWRVLLAAAGALGAVASWLLTKVPIAFR
jgi:hypothetical protein